MSSRSDERSRVASCAIAFSKQLVASLSVTQAAGRVVVWRERRRDGLRISIALPDFSYFVSIAIRARGKLFLATAFPPTPGYQKKLEKKYKRAAARP